MAINRCRVGLAPPWCRSGICPACDFEVFVVKRYWFFDGGASSTLRFYFSQFL